MPTLRPCAILEAAIYVSDLDAAKAFYGRVLGLDVIAEQVGRHVFFRCGTTVLLIFNPAATLVALAGRLPVPTHGATGQGHVCFVADRNEIDQWRVRFLAEGIAIDAEFDWPNGAHSLYVRDPSGNSVEFAEARLWD